MTNTLISIRLRAGLRRWVAHPLQAAAALAVFGLFRLLPVVVASTAGGRLLRLVGPHLRIDRVARRNLVQAFPELADDPVRLDALVDGMWDNLGRTLGEYPHLRTLMTDGRVAIEGGEFITGLRDDDAPGIFISGHLGNWELGNFIAGAYGLAVTVLYRAANNPLVEWLYRKGRGTSGVAMIPKGRRGARQALAVLKGGGHLVMLVDQKMNDGIAVPFFGRDAMTAPAVAQFAIRFGCPVVPARVIRLPGVRFRVIVEPALDLPSTGDRHADEVATMVRLNAILERWIREHPEQWLWVHRRWPG